MADPTDPQPIDIGSLGLSEDVLPKEYGNAFFSNLDSLLQKSERNQLNTLYDNQEERGFFRSGQTERKALEDVVLPGQEARRGALLDLARTAIGQQREERMAGTQFDRTKQLASDEFDRRLKEIELQAKQQRELLQLQASLGINMPGKNPGFGEIFAASFAGGLGKGLGSRIGG